MTRLSTKRFISYVNAHLNGASLSSVLSEIHDREGFIRILDKTRDTSGRRFTVTYAVGASTYAVTVTESDILNASDPQTCLSLAAARTHGNFSDHIEIFTG